MAETQQRKLRARYKTVGPKLVTKHYTKCHMDETKSMVQEPATKQVKMWMVYLPQGHSVRLEEKELKRMGYHLKPRIVDMLTGDVIEMGGDPYDFGEPEEEEIVIDDFEEDDGLSRNPARR
jgi:hypothetical protein